MAKRIAAACECSDKGCAAHKDAPLCWNTADTTLYRIDMEDNTGTRFCDACADDACSSGLFTTRDFDAERA